MDSSRNQRVNKKQDLNGFKDNSALGLPTLNKILELSSKVSLLPLIKSSSTLIKKKPHYKIVPTKEAKLKKKINSNIGKQNIVIKKRIKK